jgi:exodeoxyribonuclease VII large subunit
MPHFMNVKDVITSNMLTVGQLNRAVSELLNEKFGLVWVRAEVSSFTLSAPGHGYLVLKDASASVKAVIFRARLMAAGFNPKAGDQVEIQARVSLYEPRGDYQLQIEVMRRAGRGALYEQFLALKTKLQSEGLFDVSAKRPIPIQPKVIGVITSPQAAALHDVLTALKRRAPQVSVVIYPTLVQGREAPLAIRRALAQACGRHEVDVLLFVRGGGSLEDLWAFNDESLARDIAASPIPTVVGVGHETDFSIADFVADLRAPTPTAAAEMACQPLAVLVGQVEVAAQNLLRAQYRMLEQRALRLDQASRRLVSPSQRLKHRADAMGWLIKRLKNQAPDMKRLQLHCAQINLSLKNQAEKILTRKQHRFEVARSKLMSYDPTAVLERGYAIVTTQQGQVVRQAEQTQPGQELSIRLGKGRLKVHVSALQNPDI